MIAKTPEAPYYAVIFTSLKTGVDDEAYQATAIAMENLAQQQPGFLGHESVRETLGITVSYWRSLDDIQQWKQQMDHLVAQQKGRSDWYAAYTTRICKVERAYSFNKQS